MAHNNSSRYFFKAFSIDSCKDRSCFTYSFLVCYLIPQLYLLCPAAIKLNSFFYGRQAQLKQIPRTSQLLLEIPSFTSYSSKHQNIQCLFQQSKKVAPRCLLMISTQHQWRKFTHCQVALFIIEVGALYILSSFFQMLS